MGEFALLGPEMLINGNAEMGDVRSWWASGGVQSFHATGGSAWQGSYFFQYDTLSATLTTSFFAAKTEIHLPMSGENYMLTAAIRPGMGSMTGVWLSAADYYPADWGLNQTFVLNAVGSWGVYDWRFSLTNQGNAEMWLAFAPVASVSHGFDAISLRRRVELNVSYDFRNSKMLEKQHVRTQAGYLYTYIGPGGYRRFEVPISWVSSWDRAVVSSWWRVGAELRFYEDDSYPQSFHSVRIVGDSEPLKIFTQPYFRDYFSGTLELETV